MPDFLPLDFAFDDMVDGGIEGCEVQECASEIYENFVVGRNFDFVGKIWPPPTPIGHGEPLCVFCLRHEPVVTSN